MKGWKPWVLLALFFGAGIAVGVAGTRFTIQRMVQEASRRPEVARERMEQTLARDLRLSPEQRTQVRQIFRRSHEDIQGVRKDIQPRVGAIQRRSEGEIRALLNERQQARFDAVLKKRPLIPPPNVQALPQR